jgi:hypothetical protein
MGTPLVLMWSDGADCVLHAEAKIFACLPWTLGFHGFPLIQ